MLGNAVRERSPRHDQLVYFRFGKASADQRLHRTYRQAFLDKRSQILIGGNFGDSEFPTHYRIERGGLDRFRCGHLPPLYRHFARRGIGYFSDAFTFRPYSAALARIVGSSSVRIRPSLTTGFPFTITSRTSSALRAYTMAEMGS